MPVDFAAVAEQFREPFTRETARLNLLFLRIGLLIDKLAERANAMERLTSGLFAFDFIGDALAVRVEISPKERVVIGPQGIVEGLKASWDETKAGFTYIPTAISAEVGMMRLVGAPATALDAIVGSARRFETVTAEVFDPARRTAGDIAGLAVMATRVLLADPKGLDKLLVGTAKEVKGSIEKLTAGGEAGGAGPTTEPAIDPILGLGARLEEAMLLLPAAVQILDVAFADVSITLRRSMLRQFEEVQASVLGLRTKVLAAILDATVDLLVGTIYLKAFEQIVRSVTGPVAAMAPTIRAFLDSLKDVWNGIKLWADWVTTFVNTYTKFVNTILDVDIAPLLLAPIVGVLPSFLLPKITMGQLLEAGIHGTLLALNLALHASLETALSLVPVDLLFPEEIQGMHDLIDAVVALRYPDIPHAAPYAGRRVGFVDVHAAMFSGGRDAELIKAVDGLGTGLRTGVTGVLDAGSTMAGDLGKKFAGEAGSIRLGDQAVRRALGPQPDEWARLAFPDRKELTTDPLAVEWDKLVADGGFTLAAAAIPVFIAQMRTLWARRRPAPDQPISPHALLRQARANGMHLSEIVIEADGTVLAQSGSDEAGAEAIAAAIAAHLGDAALTTIHRAELGASTTAGGR